MTTITSRGRIKKPAAPSFISSPREVMSFMTPADGLPLCWAMEKTRLFVHALIWGMLQMHRAQRADCRKRRQATKQYLYNKEALPGLHLRAIPWPGSQKSATYSKNACARSYRIGKGQTTAACRSKKHVSREGRSPACLCSQRPRNDQAPRGTRCNSSTRVGAPPQV